MLAMMAALLLAILGGQWPSSDSVKPIAGNNSSEAQEISMALSPDLGILRIPSKLSVDATVARLQGNPAKPRA